MFTDIFNESSSVYDGSTNLFEYDDNKYNHIMSDSFIPRISESKMTLTPNDIFTINERLSPDIYLDEMFLSPKEKDIFNYNTDQSSQSISIIESMCIKKLRKKRGRQNGRNERQHTVFKNDCRMAKIQTSYFTFLIFFLNSILKKNNLKYRFFQLDGKYKSNINQKFRALLNLKTIKEILEQGPISTKYKKNDDKEHNKNIIKKLKEGGYDIILNILDKNFLFFFDKIYFANLKKFNLSSFELSPLDVELLPKTKLFKDLLNKNKDEDFYKYKGEMERCAKKYFFLNSKNRFDINEENSN